MHAVLVGLPSLMAKLFTPSLRMHWRCWHEWITVGRVAVIPTLAMALASLYDCQTDFFAP
jgi:hypothetical protein